MSATASYTSGFYQLGARRLFVVEHIPESPRGAVLMVSPFLEEMVFCRRLLRHIATLLSEQGWHVLRFDGFGEGDSEGELANADMIGAIADIRALAQDLQARCDGPLIGIGWRWGSSLMLSAAEAFDALIAVEPLAAGEEYVQQLLRQNLTSQMAAWGKVRFNREALLEQSAQQHTLNIQGFELGPALITQMRTWQWPERITVPLTLVRSVAPGSPAIESWQQRAAQLKARLYQLPNKPYWFEPRVHAPRLPVIVDAVMRSVTELSSDFAA